MLNDSYTKLSTGQRPVLRPRLTAFISTWQILLYPFFISILLLLQVPDARADCETSSDGFTKTCNGSITTSQTFNHLDNSSVSTFSLIFNKLSSNKISTSSNAAIEFLTNGNSESGHTAGVTGSSQIFNFNTDSAIDSFIIESFSAPAVEIKTTGGNGGSPGEDKRDSGDAQGSDGSAGGDGGAITASITDTLIKASPGKPFVASSFGGHAGDGAEGHSDGFGYGYGGAGGEGGHGRNITINLDAVTITNQSNGNAPVLNASSIGGNGSEGGEGEAADYTAQGGTGGEGVVPVEPLSLT